jgi:hypothetical protein
MFPSDDNTHYMFLFIQSPYTAMNNAAVIIGIGIVVAIVGIFLYTNIFQLAKPGVETSINSTENLASKVQGKDVVSKAEEIASSIKNMTSQIKVQNPLEPPK